MSIKEFYKEHKSGLNTIILTIIGSLSFLTVVGLLGIITVKTIIPANVILFSSSSKGNYIHRGHKDKKDIWVKGGERVKTIINYKL